MTTKLLVQATVKFLSGIVLTASLIFLPAGTFLFPNGWLLMAVMFFPMLLAGIFLFLKRPQLLQKRLNTKETQKEQYDLIKLSALMFLSGFVTAGLDFRFGWSALPHSVSLTAAAIFLASYVLYAEVLRENAYLSRTIEVQENQTLVDTGLYALVRHPMYSASVLMFLSIPLILAVRLSHFPDLSIFDRKEDQGGRKLPRKRIARLLRIQNKSPLPADTIYLVSIFT